VLWSEDFEFEFHFHDRKYLGSIPFKTFGALSGRHRPGFGNMKVLRTPIRFAQRRFDIPEHEASRRERFFLIWV